MNNSNASQTRPDTISSSFMSLADSVHSLAVAGSTEGFPGAKTKEEIVVTSAFTPSTPNRVQTTLESPISQLFIVGLPASELSPCSYSP